MQLALSLSSFIEENKLICISIQPRPPKQYLIFFT